MNRLRAAVFLVLVIGLVWPGGISSGAQTAQQSQMIQAQALDWQNIRPGIDYVKVHLTSPRPIDIFIGRMTRVVSTTTVDTAIGQGQLISGAETVRGMAARYDRAVNYAAKTWGQRNDVAIAINGYFFGGVWEPSSRPWNGVVNSGWYSKQFRYTSGDEIRGDMGFVWTLDRQAHIGDCVLVNDKKQKITYLATGVAQNFDGLNRERGDDELIIYTPQWSGTTGTDDRDDSIEVLVEMGTPLGVKSTNVGVIREIQNKLGNSLLPFDHIVLSATGTARDIVKNNAFVGDQVQIAQEISNCLASQYPFDYTNTYAGLGGDYHFLSDGVIRTDFSNPDAGVPNSRTAIGFNSEYVYFIVVDAFNPGISEGMTVAELANYFKNTLGATWAVSLDSGTSSTMVVNGNVVNNTYCTYTRKCGSLAEDDEVRNLPVGVYNSPRVPGEGGVDEALVGDAMLMVSVLPRALSTTFVTNQAVLTLVDTALRLGPGENYARIITLPAGTQGSVVAHGAGLNGVRAKGGDAYAAADAYWWKINFNGQIGWVREDALWGGATPGEDERAIQGLAAISTSPTLLGTPTTFWAGYSDGTNMTFQWDFGDGTQADGELVTHTYALTGEYLAQLTASNSLGSQTAETSVHVVTELIQMRLPLIEK